MMNRKGITRGVVLLMLVFGYNTGKTQRMLSLEEAIATALQNNFDIQLSKNDSLVAALDYKYRNAVFLPALNGNASTTWNNNDQPKENKTISARTIPQLLC